MAARPALRTIALLALRGCLELSASAAPLPAFVTPRFNASRSLASLPGIDVRDPTTALWDPTSRTWHLYATHQPSGAEGYAAGTISHFSLNASRFDDPTARWRHEGEVVAGSGTAGAFDAHAVFTPGAVRDCAADGGGCAWFLFFGGVADPGGAHAESIGVAESSSPWGPFVRRSREPVVSREDGANAAWCAAQGMACARVDEIKPLRGSDGARYLAVKSVCANATTGANVALPALYRPRNASGWGPPYEPLPAPLFPLFLGTPTCESRGFEEPTFFAAADGFLHFIAHDHGSCASGRYAHYVSASHALDAWVEAPAFAGPQGGPARFTEPVPVPLAGDGVYGGPVFAEWIDFGTWLNASSRSMELVYSTVSWVWSNASGT